MKEALGVVNASISFRASLATLLLPKKPAFRLPTPETVTPWKSPWSKSLKSLTNSRRILFCAQCALAQRRPGGTRWNPCAPANSSPYAEHVEFCLTCFLRWFECKHPPLQPLVFRHLQPVQRAGTCDFQGYQISPEDVVCLWLLATGDCEDYNEWVETYDLTAPIIELWKRVVTESASPIPNAPTPSTSSATPRVFQGDARKRQPQQDRAPSHEHCARHGPRQHVVHDVFRPSPRSDQFSSGDLKDACSVNTETFKTCAILADPNPDFDTDDPNIFSWTNFLKRYMAPSAAPWTGSRGAFHTEIAPRVTGLTAEDHTPESLTGVFYRMFTPSPDAYRYIRNNIRGTAKERGEPSPCGFFASSSKT